MKKILLICMLAGCTSQESFDEAAKEKVAKEAEEFLDAYHRAMEQDGLMSELDYLDASEEFFWVPPGFKSALSYDSVIAILEKNAPAIQSMSLRWQYLQIYPLSPEIVDFTGKLENTMVDTANTTTKLVMLETGTLIKRKKGWQLLNGQSRIVDDE